MRFVTLFIAVLTLAFKVACATLTEEQALEYLKNLEVVHAKICTWNDKAIVEYEQFIKIAEKLLREEKYSDKLRISTLENIKIDLTEIRDMFKRIRQDIKNKRGPLVEELRAYKEENCALDEKSDLCNQINRKIEEIEEYDNNEEEMIKTHAMEDLPNGVDIVRNNMEETMSREKAAKIEFERHKEEELRAREEAERRVREEEQLAREEAERLARDEAERHDREEGRLAEEERRAREEAERLIREEAERRALEEAERQLKTKNKKTGKSSENPEDTKADKIAVQNLNKLASQFDAKLARKRAEKIKHLAREQEEAKRLAREQKRRAIEKARAANLKKKGKEAKEARENAINEAKRKAERKATAPTMKYRRGNEKLASTANPVENKKADLDVPGSEHMEIVSEGQEEELRAREEVARLAREEAERRALKKEARKDNEKAKKEAREARIKARQDKEKARIEAREREESAEREAIEQEKRAAMEAREQERRAAMAARESRESSRNAKAVRENSANDRPARPNMEEFKKNVEEMKKKNAEMLAEKKKNRPQDLVEVSKGKSIKKEKSEQKKVNKKADLNVSERIEIVPEGDRFEIKMEEGDVFMKIEQITREMIKSIGSEVNSAALQELAVELVRNRDRFSEVFNACTVDTLFKTSLLAFRIDSILEESRDKNREVVNALGIFNAYVMSCPRSTELRA